MPIRQVLIYTEDNKYILSDDDSCVVIDKSFEYYYRKKLGIYTAENNFNKRTNKYTTKNNFIKIDNNYEER